MNRIPRGLLSLTLGAFVGFSGAFLFAPDPTGVLPLAAGSASTVAVTAIVYAGIGRAARSNAA